MEDQRGTMSLPADVVPLGSLPLPLFPASALSDSIPVRFKTLPARCPSQPGQRLLAWRMYSEDSNDQIPYASALNTPYGWITGDLDFEPSNRSNWDVEIDIKKS